MLTITDSLLAANTIDLDALDEMSMDQGFCGGQCRPNSLCFADIFMGVETCMCTRGHWLRQSETPGEDDYCSPCRIHSYKAEAGNQACTSCPPPMYSNSTGNTGISQCTCPIDVINNSNQNVECIGNIIIFFIPNFP